MRNRPNVSRRRQAAAMAPERILDMNELARAEPVRATRMPPSRLLRELERAERIPLHAEAMEIAPRVASRATRRPSKGAGYRPPWADLERRSEDRRYREWMGVGRLRSSAHGHLVGVAHGRADSVRLGELGVGSRSCGINDLSQRLSIRRFSSHDRDRLQRTEPNPKRNC
jgi:hypothetical protein